MNGVAVAVAVGVGVAVAGIIGKTCGPVGMNGVAVGVAVAGIICKTCGPPIGMNGVAVGVAVAGIICKTCGTVGMNGAAPPGRRCRLALLSSRAPQLASPSPVLSVKLAALSV